MCYDVYFSYFYVADVHLRTQNFLPGRGGWDDPEAVHTIFHFKNYVTKLRSKYD